MGWFFEWTEVTNESSAVQNLISDVPDSLSLGHIELD